MPRNGVYLFPEQEHSPTEKPYCFVHPLALCESDQVGEGTRIWAFSHVMAKARLGKNVNVGEQVFIESGAVVEDNATIKNGVMLWEGVSIGAGAFVGPGAVFTNDRLPRSPRLGVPEVVARYKRKSAWLCSTVVEEGASIGAGAVILPGVRVGAFAMVAAGSVVTTDVSPHRLVAGNPARSRGWVCRAGQVLKVRDPGALLCPLCGKIIPVFGNAPEFSEGC
ncbi:MAG: acyltransferase [Pseudomonadota bacterium]